MIQKSILLGVLILCFAGCSPDYKAEILGEWIPVEVKKNGTIAKAQEDSAPIWIFFKNGEYKIINREGAPYKGQYYFTGTSRIQLEAPEINYSREATITFTANMLLLSYGDEMLTLKRRK